MYKLIFIFSLLSSSYLIGALSGEISNGWYFAPNKRFKTDIPSSEYTFNRISDAANDDEANVIFWCDPMNEALKVSACKVEGDMAEVIKIQDVFSATFKNIFQSEAEKHPQSEIIESKYLHDEVFGHLYFGIFRVKNKTRIIRDGKSEPELCDITIAFLYSVEKNHIVNVSFYSSIFNIQKKVLDVNRDETKLCILYLLKDLRSKIHVLTNIDMG